MNHSFFHFSMRKAFFALCLMAAALPWQPVQAQTTVVESAPLVNPVSLSSTGSASWLGFRFRVGATAQRIHEWSALFETPTPPNGGGVTMRLFEVDPVSGFPAGAALASTTLAWVDGVNTYTAANLGAIATTTLVANTPYALVAGGGPGGNVNWGNQNSDYTFSDGFSKVKSGTTLVTNNSGTSWSESLFYPWTQLKVAPPPPAPVPVAATAVPLLGAGALWALGLGVMGAGAWRLRRRAA